jgi:hypothetical protein
VAPIVRSGRRVNAIEICVQPDTPVLAVYADFFILLSL